MKRDAQQVDAFDGVYDNTETGHRELYRDGRLVTHFRRGLEPPLARQFGMTGEWGTFPDRPGARQGASE